MCSCSSWIAFFLSFCRLHRFVSHDPGSCYCPCNLPRHVERNYHALRLARSNFYPKAQTVGHTLRQLSIGLSDFENSSWLTSPGNLWIGGNCFLIFKVIFVHLTRYHQFYCVQNAKILSRMDRQGAAVPDLGYSSTSVHWKPSWDLLDFDRVWLLNIELVRINPVAARFRCQDRHYFTDLEASSYFVGEKLAFGSDLWCPFTICHETSIFDFPFFVPSCCSEVHTGQPSYHFSSDLFHCSVSHIAMPEPAALHSLQIQNDSVPVQNKWESVYSVIALLTCTRPWIFPYVLGKIWSLSLVFWPRAKSKLKSEFLFWIVVWSNEFLL